MRKASFFTFASRQNSTWRSAHSITHDHCHLDMRCSLFHPAEEAKLRGSDDLQIPALKDPSWLRPKRKRCPLLLCLASKTTQDPGPTKEALRGLEGKWTPEHAGHGWQCSVFHPQWSLPRQPAALTGQHVKQAQVPSENGELGFRTPELLCTTACEVGRHGRLLNVLHIPSGRRYC